MSNSLGPYGSREPTSILSPWDSPGKNTGEGCHAPPGNLPYPGTEPVSVTSSAFAGRFFLEKEMANHSSILAWKIPWTEEPGGLQSMGSQRVGHDWSDFTFTILYHFSLVPLWVSPLQGEIYVLHLPRQKDCKMITPWTKITISLQFGFNL